MTREGDFVASTFGLSDMSSTTRVGDHPRELGQRHDMIGEPGPHHGGRHRRLRAARRIEREHDAATCANASQGVEPGEPHPRGDADEHATVGRDDVVDDGPEIGLEATIATAGRGLGDVQRMSNGNTVVAYSTQGVLQEVDAQGTLLQEIVWPLGGAFGYIHKRASLYGPPPR